MKYELMVRRYSQWTFSAFGATLRTTLECSTDEQATHAAAFWVLDGVEVIVRTEDGLTQYRSISGKPFVKTDFKPVVLTP